VFAPNPLLTKSRVASTYLTESGPEFLGSGNNKITANFTDKAPEIMISEVIFASRTR
jgi:hypothetical protein